MLEIGFEKGGGAKPRDLPMHIGHVCENTPPPPPGRCWPVSGGSALASASASAYKIRSALSLNIAVFMDMFV